MRQTKLLGEPDKDGRVVVNKEYIQRLRTECRERRIHEKQLEAEIRALRGDQGPDAGAVAAYALAALATSDMETQP